MGTIEAFAFVAMLCLVVEHTFLAGVRITINAEVTAGVVHSDIFAHHASELLSSQAHRSVQHLFQRGNDSYLSDLSVTAQRLQTFINQCTTNNGDIVESQVARVTIELYAS